MEFLIPSFFSHQWQRKLLALVTAIAIWMFVNQSITSTKVLPFIPIRLINLPADQTVQGILPNGLLTKRTNLTLSGTKDVIEKLEAGDLEVLIDIVTLPEDGWVQITRKNLISLDPSLDLNQHITAINHPELWIKISPLITEKIPIQIQVLNRSPSSGFTWIDVWPVQLHQTVSGPQELVESLKTRGLVLELDVNAIPKDALKTSAVSSLSEEIAFFVPDSWKRISLPFLSKGQESINDPSANELTLYFLKDQPLPLTVSPPLSVFYPSNNASPLFPTTYPLEGNRFVQVKNGVSILQIPLFVRNVSSMFLETVKNFIAIEVIATSSSQKELFDWNVRLVNPAYLEQLYVSSALQRLPPAKSNAHRQERESWLKKRFGLYKRSLSLYTSTQRRLQLDATLGEGTIKVTVAHVK